MYKKKFSAADCPNLSTKVCVFLAKNTAGKCPDVFMYQWVIYFL